MNTYAQAAETASFDRPQPRIVTAALAVAAFILLVDLAFDVIVGGNIWRQGDWLINSHQESVRRGLLGSLIISLADTLSISPLYVLAVLQASLVIVLFTASIVVFRKVADRREYLLLLASPAFFVIFWLADYNGALRKELIAYCAIALLLTYPICRSKIVVVLATILFVTSCLCHEANTLFLSLFLAILLLISCGMQDRMLVRACGAVAIVGAVSGFAYAIMFSAVSDASVVCKPLLERGMLPPICNGAIQWVTHDTAYALQQVASKMNTPENVYMFPLYYVMAFMPLLYLASLTTRPKSLYIVYGLCGLPFLPLFVIALDWGRWMNFHVTSAVFLTLALGLTGRLHFARSVPATPLILALLVAIIWAPAHENGLTMFGTAGRLIGEIAQCL